VHVNASQDSVSVLRVLGTAPNMSHIFRAASLTKGETTMKTRTKVNVGLLPLAWALLTVFAVAPLHAQTYQDLYDFNCATGGCSPVDHGQLTQWKDGNLYGTTSNGGSHGYGTIFEVTPLGTYTDLLEFDYTNGAGPSAGLTLASDGNFYGTTFGGGTSDDGTVFRFTPPSTLTVLHIFSGGTDGQGPEVPPTQAKDGNLYGMTDSGTTYRVTLPGGKFTVLPNQAPGYTLGPLDLASDGNLYGTTFNGGSSGNGTVFRMTTAGAIKTIYNFTAIGSDGAGPSGPLTQGKDGNLYGTTVDGGGVNDWGTTFKLTLSGIETVLHVFDSSIDGANPYAGLLASSYGNFYGLTGYGGTDGDGTLFEMTAGGSCTKFVDFTGTAGTAPGQFPLTTLMQHTNGSLFGLTLYGGSSGQGNFYSFTPLNPLFTVVVEGPVWVKPGVPVEILGDNLTHAIQVTFAGEQTQFQIGSDTYLTAMVPSDAVDGLIAVILDSGLQIESQSVEHIVPVITNLDPTSGAPGTQVGIVGGGFAGAKQVTFSGVKAPSFNVVSPTFIQAIVPTGAKTGKVGVTTPNGTAKSKQTFTVT
jgi:uncharacterized repeat protein (TIGR03803 family)